MTETSKSSEHDRIRQRVEQGYGRIARNATSGRSPVAAGADATARRIGYSDDEISAVPEGANLGLGCGNPTAIDSLREGEVVLDLGSGAGFDAFLAARRVGPAGRVIGVDMTDAMLEKARANAEAGGFENVEFRKGQIEALPVEGDSVDVVISNCVINLSPEKDRVFAEALRVLRPGGRLMISDIVLERPLPEAIVQHAADFGVAWDGDFDRCFLFDHKGRFIEGYYIVGLLAVQLLKQNPGALIVHDPRLTWNTRELVEQNQGQPVLSKAGHAFIKETMREVNAVYGGEMSAHHYFRDFGYCDSGMIPWLLLAQMMSNQNKSLAELVDEGIEAFPVSGEINVAVDNPQAVIESVKSHFGKQKHSLDEIDGLSMDFGDWRFNLRPSNTEPLLRMNLETRGDYQLMEQKRDELLRLIGA